MMLFFPQAAGISPDESSAVGGGTTGAFQPFSSVLHGDGKLLRLLSLVEQGVDDAAGYCPELEMPIAPTTNLANVAAASTATLPLAECCGADFDSVVETQDLSDDNLVEYFTNGFGLELSSKEGSLLKGITETKKTKTSFIEDDKEWSGLTLPLTVLPFVWHMRRHGRVHHYSDIFNTVSIVAQATGFKSALDYVNCRGWTFSTKDGKMRLQYRKLDQVVDRLAPNSDTARLVKNFNAMIEHLYEILDLPMIKDIYTNLPACPRLEKLSFASKIHSHTQDLQFSFVVVGDFYIAHVPNHFGDIEYWAKVIYRDCRYRKDYCFMIYNLLFLFQGDNGDPVLARRLLTNYQDCMRDEVSRLASSAERKRRYEARLEAKLHDASKGRGTKKGMPSPERRLLLCRARARDMVYPYLTNEEKKSFQSSTRKKKKRSSKAAGNDSGE